jgi:isopenicillin-N epimerase
MKDAFLLEPDVIFLNHGSFGATPKEVFEVYQNWQRRLEAQPVRFFVRELGGHLASAREALANYVGAQPSQLVFIPNATFGVNAAARSLRLGPGDEVLGSDQEYGACTNIWSYLSERQGFSYKTVPVPLGVDSETMLASLWQGVSERTRVIFLSHITSPTAQTLPVEAICQRAREAGILTIIDGAHAPGQLDLKLSESYADIYMGNCHKWLCSPKGAGFLYAHSSQQALIEPLIIGWGRSRPQNESLGSSFLDSYDWLGTSDPASYLSVPAAIAFQRANHWCERQAWCHALLKEALEALGAVTGLSAPYADDTMYCQLAVAPLPRQIEAQAFQERLYHDYAIEIPATTHNDQPYLRISVQAYNTRADLEALTEAVAALLAP